MRRRPLLRAAVVGGGAYLAGKNAAQRQADQRAADQQAADQQAAAGAYQQPSPQVPAQPPPSILDHLTQLSALHDKGALTDDEFTAAKARLLGGGAGGAA
jgi:Short C-terminal domain